MSTPGDFEQGEIFAKDFRVLRRLRAGGMGSVFVVEQISTSKQRALKLLAPGLAQHADIRERFMREARAGAMIDSDHVVEVVSAGVEEETATPYLVMELLRGEDLAELVERDGAQAPTVVAEIFAQIGHALALAHQEGIVHRDLKPENVFLSTARRPDSPFTAKILDFGVAKFLAAGSSQQGTQPVGSPLFMAPEQTDTHGRICPSTDVWALGLLAFYLLTGHSYWIGAADASVPALLREVCFDPIVPATERAERLGVADKLPPGFDNWFARCVERDIDLRYVDAGACSQALIELLRSGAVPEPPPKSEHPPLFAEPSLGTDLPAILEPGPDTSSVVDETSTAGMALPARDSAASVVPETVKSPDGAPTPRRRLALPAWAKLAAAGLGAAILSGGGGGLVAFSLTRGPGPHGSASAHAPAAHAGSTPPGRASAAPTEAPHAHAPKVHGPKAAPSATVKPAPSASAHAAPSGPELATSPRCPPEMALIEGGGEPFCLAGTELSLGEWERCVASGACSKAEPSVAHAAMRPDVAVRYEVHCTLGRRDKSHPINCVSWEQAKQACASLGARLPKRREWELAAHGPRSARAHAWGNGPLDPKRLNACDEECVSWGFDSGLLFAPAVVGSDDFAGVAPVGSYREGRSPEGIDDLEGNVAEWVEDAEGSARLAMGGSFLSMREDAFVAPLVLDPRATTPAVGVRCAADAK